ncbi:MAG: hypothetical protein AAGM22_25380 [Acidobacteriota bacterium]
MKKSAFLALIAVAALVLAPAASAIIPCELCPENVSVTDRCIGACNGVFTLFCVDYLLLGCSANGLLTSPPSDLDTIFPKPIFMQPQAALLSTPASPACL